MADAAIAHAPGMHHAVAVEPMLIALAATFQRLGLSESAAATAANGR
jgi:hypothetical protein